MPFEIQTGDPHMRRISASCFPRHRTILLIGLLGAFGCGEGTKPDADTVRDTGREVEDGDVVLDVDDADPGVDAASSETDAGTETDSNIEDIVLTACSANRDCAGGQVCRDGYCRTACAASAECSPPLSVCDEVKGYCVDCVGDGDCGNNRACNDGICAFYCREDSACSAEEFCVFETGACAVRECESSLECSGGYRCERFVCLPIDEIVCEPDEVTCSGDFGAIETCNGDGTGVESAPCETGMRCVDSGAGVACATVVCTPNEVGCEGGLSIFACDSSGTVKTVTGCEMGQYCNAGVCEEHVCEPSSVVCDSDSVVTCDEFGASEAVEACGDREGCDGELGCRCVDGECRPRICAPASARCVAGSLEGREVCDADGLAYVAEACDSSETCVAGECLPRVCAPNMPKCVGAGGSQTCFADGLGFAQTVSCNPGSSCLASTGLCSPWICTPGTTSCATTGIRRTCNEDGLGFADIACGPSSTCNSGNCSPWICTPNSFSCLSVNARQQCNADGLAYSSAPCSGPAANGYACLGQGLCAERMCIPGSAGPCASLTERQTCNADGQGYSTNSCAVNQSCSGGICQDRICTAGNTRCVAGTLTGREVCAGDGLAWNNAPCGSTESCSGSGNCLPRICTPGESRCVAGSLTGRETCAADGLSWTSTSCSASQSCTGAGICQERVCTPSSLDCLSITATRSCSADGLSFTSSACNIGQSCNAGSCAVRCGDGIVGAGEICDDGNIADGDQCSNSCTRERASCRVSGQGLSDCGLIGDTSCCVSPLVTGGTFARSFDGVSANYKDASYVATISSFRLDQFEVTVGRFRQFVAAWASGWRPNAGAGRHTHINSGSGLVNSGTAGGFESGWDPAWGALLPSTKADWDAKLLSTCNITTWTSSPGANERRPQNCVNWPAAYAFCIWDSGFLPSEAEWNYAAAGGGEQRVFPWSVPAASTSIDSTRARYGIPSTNATSIAEVGIHPAGKGRWGHFDLAGNVYEWNLDWFTSNYATTSCIDCSNTAPALTLRSLRGGHWNDAGTPYMLTSWHGANDRPTDWTGAMGFRCATPP
jgi:sulfatase modifying factor 1